ncbi:MAG TPA: tetratricopeptide repeat protein [Blastocatellia bacterium]|nr:tetratricopeptide repeat protein [Blastocatellia bacterium]
MINLSYRNIGGLYSSLGDKQKTLDYYNEALRLIQSVDEKSDEARTLSNIGLVYQSLDEKTKALDYYNQALTIYKAVGDKSAEATTLNNIGSLYDELDEKQKALDYYNQALPLKQSLGDKPGQATTLNNIGIVYDDLGDRQKALDYYNQALPLYRAAGHRPGEASTLNNLGAVYNNLGDRHKAIDYYNQALAIRRAINDKSGEAISLGNLGKVYGDLDDWQKALDYDNQALSLYKAMGDKSGEATSLINLGAVYNNLGDRQKAIDYYNQALPLMQRVGDKSGEATALNSLGRVYDDLGDKQKTLDYYNQALPLYRAASDRSGEAGNLNNFGQVYSDLGDKQKAFDYCNQALSIYRAIGAKPGEASTLNNLGSLYDDLDERQKAIDYYDQALAIYKVVGDISGEATALNNLGGIYQGLGEKQKAIDQYNQALPLMQKIDNKPGEATLLNNLGVVHHDLGERQKALDYYDRALALHKATGNRSGEAATLVNIGFSYSSSGERQKAIDYYDQALSLAQAISDTEIEVQVLNNLGGVYEESGERQNALDYYNRALFLAKALSSKLSEARTLNNMMFTWGALRNHRFAAFYGEKSVNTYQQLRRGAQEFKDKEFHKTFLKSFEDTYRKLSELLIEQGRFAEAQQVLNALKDQQYFDFNPATVKRPAPVALTQREAELSSRYDAASGKIGEIGRQLKALKLTTGNRTPNAEPSARRQQLEADLKIAEDEFLAVIKQAETEFSGPPDAVKDKPPNVVDTRDMQAALHELDIQTKQKAVAVYTLVGEHDFWALLITPKEIIPIVSLSKSKELNEKTKEFLIQLKDTEERTGKPKFSEAQVQKTGKALYDIVFAPVAAKLKELHIRPDLLMWSLDGGLRYVPIAALYDGRQYLAERYSNVVFTRADAKRMLSHVRETWTGVGFYNSQEYSVPVRGQMETFRSLQNARLEVETIFGIPPAQGIVNGKFLPNRQFTLDSLREKLRLHSPLVHISSHFRLVPGDASSSFLLLGDGKMLTLADIRNEPDDLFGGVELLTISACETGLQRESELDGREIDSFAELAQRKGAQAILASLWNVDDKSTSRLMMEFYQKRQLNKLTKAEALQKAQLSLLKDSGYSHPFYWSPFILIGNWR